LIAFYMGERNPFLDISMDRISFGKRLGGVSIELFFNILS